MSSLRSALAFGCVVLIGCGSDATSVRSESLAEMRARGAAAFYETLYGAADRREEVVEVALAIRRQDPDDLYSYWWPAAMRMLRANRGWRTLRDLDTTPAEIRRDVTLAKEEIAEAVQLAESQGVTIPIMTTWPGMTTYLDGILRDDDALQASGVEQLRRQAIVQPRLGNLMFVEIVGQVAAVGDPLLDEAVEHARRALQYGARENCPTNRDACGSSASAPHNLEGALLIFGDALLKAGELESARQIYSLGLDLGSESNWPYLSVVEQRLAAMEERAALYDNDDPGDDPLFGTAGQLCEGCHYN